jgi:UDP-GlcNAc:undecaprenyl-phosphate GlcNAc-1-phosphate transferase
MGGAILLHVLGLVDDRRGLPWFVKLAGQLLCLIAVVLLADIRLLEVLGEPTSSILSVAWLVLIVNAFNLLDHMDGLAAGVAAICSAALLAAAAAGGQMLIAGWLCLLLGASLGFLVHNFPPAKLFMGDAGSMILGYALAVLSILTTYRTGGPEAPYYSVFVPVVLLAVPLYDTLSVLTLRLRERRNPMIGDTRHFCHRLLRRGMSPRKAVLTIYLATAATAVGASLLPHVTDLPGAILVFSQAAGIVLLIAVLESADARAKK